MIAPESVGGPILGIESSSDRRWSPIAAGLLGPWTQEPCARFRAGSARDPLGDGTQRWGSLVWGDRAR